MVMIQQEFAGHPALARLERGDGSRLCAFFYLLSPETLYRRFLSPIARLDQVPAQLLDLVAGQREAVVAVIGGDIVAVARFSRQSDDPAAAELAIVVADAWQRQGIGTRLLATLADAARGLGIERFTFVSLPENQAVVRLLKRLAPTTHFEFASGLLEGYVPLVAA